MKYTRKNLSKSQIELAVNLETSDIEPLRQAVVERMSKELKVAGFRKGKVPAKMAEKYLNQQAVIDEVVGEAINKALIDIIVKEQIQPLDKPNAKVSKLVPFDQIEFSVEIDIIPPVKLGGYMGLKAKYEAPKISDDDVEKLIENLRSQGAEKKEVKRAAQNGDEVLIDFVGKRDGKEFAGGKAEKVPLILGSDQMIPGFESAIVGHKAGQDFTIDVTFPKQYGNKELAGKKAQFDIKLYKVSEVKKPELDDKFAAKMGPFYTVKELRDAAKSELSGRAEFEATEKFKGDLLTELVGKTKLDVPAVLVDDQLKALQAEAEDNIKYRGLGKEQYFAQNDYKDEADWLEREVRPEAERRVKNGLVLSELVRQEDIEVSDAEIDAQQQQIMGQYNDEKLKERLNTPEARRNIANRIATEKALQKLVAYNK
ncbi:MAG: trigger factor [Candidatus Nomurabacteria bacterium]|jgi:trigger factor|nr:trigger factor [Candidatus Nomurabacteria bacterium]